MNYNRKHSSVSLEHVAYKIIVNGMSNGILANYRRSRWICGTTELNANDNDIGEDVQ